jgi:hypothetical protein
MKTIKGLAMHVHHDVLFEYCYDYVERVQAIKDTKPKNEQPARLKLFKMLSKEAINELPRRIMKALSELEKARSEWNKACSEWDGREAWHKKHCGCKEWNGEEIVFNNE